ncbi:AAA family ATPase [Polaromonas sp. AET17H-212]|uniref:AAA family ATPase n=1 Tax=Polaromonas sp. AET17H-212 TaxID=1977061 RepID=UPI0020D090C6|nr:ATP-binding protein [Polaromonas sp. AET17H-212]
MRNTKFSLMGALQESAGRVGMFATFALMVVLVVFPLVGIWLTWVVNAFQGTMTTFDWSLGDKGQVLPTRGLLFLSGPVAFLLAFHLLRFVTALLGSGGEAGVAIPMTASVGLSAASAWVVKFYGATFAIWLALADHGPHERYWPFASVVALGIASWWLVKSEFLYGFKAKPSQLRVRAQNDAGEVAVPEVARVIVPKLTFKDIHGNTDLKKRLLAAGHAITAPRAEGVKPRNGILLGGDPGNGKTVLAEALAGELKLPFLTLTHSDVASQWVGERTVRIKAAFDQAIRNQPCMLFIDEIDSFLPTRGDSAGQNKEDSDVVNSLLTLLVDVRRHRVVIVAATNYMDRLDGAAIREGRFDFKIEVSPPDQDARVGLLQSGIKAHTPTAQVSPDVLRSVALRWNGFSVKRILAVTEEMPSYLADKVGGGGRTEQLTFDDFMSALRRIQGQRGAKPENVKSLSEMVFPDFTRNALAMIASRLADPVRVERLGGSLPTGVLFFGPPGTGKTAACKALAKEVGWTFLIATGADLARDPKALEKLYTKAKELRPTLIFIDEADELLRSREYSQNTEATNKLLTLMEGVNDRVRDVLWVAATNNPDQIDPALLRGGRFTEKVEFVRPSGAQLVAHLTHWLAHRKVDMAPDFSVEELVQLMGDQSIANAEAICQHAVNRAISQTDGDQIVISRSDVDVAITTVLGDRG